MKTQIIISILFVIILSANGVSAVKYSNTLEVSNSYTQVSSKHKAEAALLRSYIVRYKDDINTLYSRYSELPSSTMQDANLLLQDMILSLDIILSQRVNPQNVETHLLAIIQDIKSLNTYMESYLKKQRESYMFDLGEKQRNYTVTTKKISKLLDSLTSSIINILHKKDRLSQKEKIIIQSIVRIQDENNKLKKMSIMKFVSQEEMQLYVKNIILALQKEIQLLRNTSRGI